MQAADFAKTFSTWRFDPCVRTKKNEATWRNSSSGEVSSVQERIRWTNPKWGPKKGLRGVRGTQGPKWSLSTLIFDNGEWYLRVFEGGSRGGFACKTLLRVLESWLSSLRYSTMRHEIEILQHSFFKMTQTWGSAGLWEIQYFQFPNEHRCLRTDSSSKFPELTRELHN